MPRDPFAPERTAYASFKMEPTAGFEFTRHRAWRAREQLHALLDNPTWLTAGEGAARLEAIAKELLDGAALLKGEKSDTIPYFDEVNMKLTDRGYEEAHVASPQRNTRLFDSQKLPLI
jgi:hypothetical protein